MVEFPLLKSFHSYSYFSRWCLLRFLNETMQDENNPVHYDSKKYTDTIFAHI